MKKTAGKNSISILLALTVFALFTACVLCVLLSGAGVYRRLVSGGQEDYARRTAGQYIAARVRQSEQADCLWTEPFGAGDSLVVAQDIGGQTYLTRVYCHEGWLMELFTHEDGEFEPADGEKLLPAQGLLCTLEDGLLTVGLKDSDAAAQELIFSLRGGEGEGP